MTIEPRIPVVLAWSLAFIYVKSHLCAWVGRGLETRGHIRVVATSSRSHNVALKQRFTRTCTLNNNEKCLKLGEIDLDVELKERCGVDSS
jgi:hypothetical protein